MPSSTTPGCLDRANNVRARAEARGLIRNRFQLFGFQLPSAFWDLYANKAQRQMAAYGVLHMALYFQMFQTDGFQLRMAYAWFDEIFAFCIYTGMVSHPPPHPRPCSRPNSPNKTRKATAILFFRDVRTVSKWEYLALVVSWSKSGVVLHQTIKSNFTAGVSFPDNKTDYALFVVVRVLVFGGLYKMVQAGLRKRWEWPKANAPTPRRQPQQSAARVHRLHRPLPSRLQRRVRPAARSKPQSPRTVEERRAYWERITQRGW